MSHKAIADQGEIKPFDLSFLKCWCHLRKRLWPCDLSVPDPENPDEVQKDAESRRTPENYTCNGSGSKKACKHQNKREQLEREKELLRRQEDTPNQEEEEEERGATEGEVARTQEWSFGAVWRQNEQRHLVGNTLATSGGQKGIYITQAKYKNTKRELLFV